MLLKWSSDETASRWRRQLQYQHWSALAACIPALLSPFKLQAVWYKVPPLLCTWEYKSSLLYKLPTPTPHICTETVCAKNHCTLPRNTSSEWFRHSAGETVTQCEVQLLVEKQKQKMEKSETRQGRGLL